MSLRDEALAINIAKCPTAFCFLVRSMFEISAHQYAVENNISRACKDKKTNKRKTKTLKELLTDITHSIVAASSSKSETRGRLHGAITQLGKSDGLLSITSMNQLVHNSTFSALPSEIPALFGNVYPLLEEMNS